MKMKKKKKNKNNNYFFWVAIVLLSLHAFIPLLELKNPLISHILLYSGGFLMGIWTQR